MSRPPSGGPIPEIVVPPGVEVRPGTWRGARGLLELLDRVGAEGRYIRSERVTPERARRIRRSLREPWSREAANIVAVSEDRVIGNLGIAREPSRETRHIASLGMAVIEEWRGRGVGSALLAEAFRWAAWTGVEKIALSVYPHNQRAVNLYEKFGFVQEGTLTGHSKKSYGYEDEVLMGRWL